MSSKKVSKQFIESLKNTAQIPQKPKQVPVPLLSSELPSPIVASNKNKKDQEIKQCPIQKICLDKPKQTTKHVTIKQQSINEKKQNQDDQDYNRAYPQHLKPSRKEQPSLIKNARDQRISRSLIDMSIYYLLDQTTDKKSKPHHGNQNILSDVAYYKQHHNTKSNSKPKIDVKPNHVNKKQVHGKDNAIKVVNNLKKKQLEHDKQKNNKNTNKNTKKQKNTKGKGLYQDLHYYDKNRTYKYEDKYYLKKQGHTQYLRSHRDFIDPYYSNIYSELNRYPVDRYFGGRLGSIGSYRQLTGIRDYQCGRYDTYRNLTRYY